MEEPGEIAGWYKKQFGYGQPREAIIVGLKGEFGDMLYYITKLAEKMNCLDVIENRFEENFEIPDTSNMDVIAALAEMSNAVVDIVQSSKHSRIFLEGISAALDLLLMLMSYEGFSLEDIQLSNLAKLEARHGDKFKDSQAIPSGRDLDAENEALS